MLSQTHSTMIRTITTDNYDSFDTVFFQLLNPFKLAFKLCKLRITSRMKESTTTRNDVSLLKQHQADKFHRQPYLRIHHRYQKLPFLLRLLDELLHGWQHSYQGRSTTGQNSNTFHLVYAPFLLTFLLIIPHLNRKILLFSRILAINRFHSDSTLIFPLESESFLQNVE